MDQDDLSDRVARMRSRFREVENALADPDVYGDANECRRLSVERGRLASFFDLYDTWQAHQRELEENRKLMAQEKDPEFRQLIESEIRSGIEQCRRDEEEVMSAILPPDPDDSRNVIMEIRPAAGGEEASLFASQLFRAYSKYAERRGWRTDVLDLSETELGGLREVTFSLAGSAVFSRLKFESGVHRVQRVPVTEAGGRIHTSTVTVSVLPEAEETDNVTIRPEDLEISTFRSSGPGGQNVNRTDSAVRIRHIPSGLVTASQQERSQIRNREIAFRILKSKLLEMQRREEAERHAASKRAQVGTGDRSERIRTYNFPQNRVTDHRFSVSAHDLPSLMEGNFDLILDPVFAEDLRIRRESFLKESGR